MDSEICCDIYEELVPTFSWFKTEDNVYLMPCIEGKDRQIRVNHCPSCGKYVRGIELSEDKMRSLISI